jgi:heme/copper-type cytochrome/quinol oxidase subunit 2
MMPTIIRVFDLHLLVTSVSAPHIAFVYYHCLKYYRLKKVGIPAIFAGEHIFYLLVLCFWSFIFIFILLIVLLPYCCVAFEEVLGIVSIKRASSNDN